MSDRPNDPPETEIDVEAGNAPTLSPRDAAERLGVKSAMLRRYASAYEQVFGSLPRDDRGARRFPIEVVQRFLTVRDLLRSNTVPSAREGFEYLRDAPKDATGSTLDVPLSEQGQVIQRLLDSLEASTAKQTQFLAQLEDETHRLRKQVEHLTNEIEEARSKRGFWARLFGR